MELHKCLMQKLVPLFLLFYSAVFCSIPTEFICYLNGDGYPTKKFNYTLGDRDGDQAWACTLSGEKECIPKRYICDQKEDCAFGSDEVKGCRLYPETNCTSWFGNKYVGQCDTNRCFNIHEFKPEDCNESFLTECRRLDAWKKHNLTDANAFHCLSGDCIPRSAVCDDNEDCQDGSDEREGCALNNDLRNYRQYLCTHPSNLTTLIEDDSENADVKLSEIGLTKPSWDGFELPTNCRKVIVVSKCDESIDFENSVIEIQPYDGANRNCTWIMFAPSGSQIILDIKEYGNKSSLKIFDGIRFEDTNLLAQRKSDRIESTGNILKIQYISDIIDARGGLRISYETTERQDCIISANCEIERPGLYGGKVCPNIKFPSCISITAYVIFGLTCLLVLVVLFVLFILRCCIPTTNSNFETKTCKDCKKNLQNYYNDSALLKQKTDMLLLGKFRVTSPIAKNNFVYGLKCFAHRRISSRSNSKIIDPARTTNETGEDYECQDLTEGPTEVPAISLKEGFDGCQTLISDNKLFKKVIHYDGRNGFTIDVWKQPKPFKDKKIRQLLCLEEDPLNIWQHSGEFGTISKPDKRLKGDDGRILGCPYKASFVVDIISNRIQLGTVRDFDLRMLYENNEVATRMSDGFLKLGNNGRLQICNDSQTPIEVLTNFTGFQFKKHINIAVIGAEHSGKSTLTGRLIYECNGIDKKSNEQIKNRLVKDKKQKKDITFPYSWVTDVSNRERDLGHTIDLAVKKIETPKSYITIIDSPGYSSGKIKGGNRIDHVQTMIVGLSQADFAVLVVSAEQVASTDINEVQTRDHAKIAYKLGIEKIVVAISKIDSARSNFSTDRYSEIRNNIFELLTDIGYERQNITFVPLSGLNGYNLVKKSTDTPLRNESSYSKIQDATKSSTTLVEAIDMLIEPEKHKEESSFPLRFVVDVVMNSNRTYDKNKGTVVCGRIKTGFIKKGMKIKITPLNCYDDYYIESIQIDKEEVMEASAGDNVGIRISNLTPKQIRPGNIISDPENEPAKKCLTFTAEIFIENSPNEIFLSTSSRDDHQKTTKHTTFFIQCHAAYFNCTLIKVLKKKDAQSRETLEPQSINNGDTALVEMRPGKAISIETDETGRYSSLSRFVIRKKEQLIGFGVVKAIKYNRNTEDNRNVPEQNNGNVSHTNNNRSPNHDIIVDA